MDARVVVIAPATLRRVAIALVLYGAAGALLVGTALLAGWTGIARLDSALGSVAEATTTLGALSDAFDSFDASLVDAQRSAERSATASRDAATTASRLADGMSINIFGAQPLAPLAQDFRREATDLASLAADLDQLGDSLARDRGDVARVRESVARLRSRVAGFGPAGGAAGIAALLVAVLGWLAVQALAALAIGIALLRRAHRAAQT